MNVDRDSIIDAIKKIDQDPKLRVGRTSSTYDLIYKDIYYPPILVLSEANKIIGGKELFLSDFKDNVNEPFRILTENGFEISKKIKSYHDELLKFIDVSDKQEIGKGTVGVQLFNKDSVKSFQDLTVEIKFGTGRASAIPWIAFLGGENTVQKGIYPVYLYYKIKKLLILAYGVSETNKPDKMWSLAHKTTIEEYFLKNGYGKPEKYGNSLVFKAYDLNSYSLIKEIDQDLNDLIKIYKDILSSKNLDLKRNRFLKDNDVINMKQIDFNYKSFHQKTKEAGLIFSEKMVARFVASLCTKPFVICSGLSGSGKTKLAQAFATWICESDNQYKLIPVGADWTNREPLLGYPDGLDNKNYVKPDVGTLDLIFKALEPKNEKKPYFLILDEMNLSHVERYFADFLSIMESKDKIKLHASDTITGVEKDFSWPKNLFIIGTVNIDETTYMFSPKVLDRANVIEFRVSENDLEKYLDSDIKLDMYKFMNATKTSGLGANMGEEFYLLAKSETRHTITSKAVLLNFFNELQKAGSEFGYRSAFEINRLIAILNQISKDDKFWDGKVIEGDEFIDIAIMQKLLPKLHGSRSKLTKVLPILGGFCVNESKKERIKELYFDKVDDIDFQSDSDIIYKISFEKICRMYRNAVENGYASYAEA